MEVIGSVLGNDTGIRSSVRSSIDWLYAMVQAFNLSGILILWFLESYP